jgi:plasmid maintenance system antidote protein VapI
VSIANGGWEQEEREPHSKKLSHLTGIPQGHISEMENGKRAIGRESAKRLGKALNINYKVFL